MEQEILDLVAAANPVPRESELLVGEQALEVRRRLVKDRSLLMHPTIETHDGEVLNDGSSPPDQPARPGSPNRGPSRRMWSVLALAGAAAAAILAVVVLSLDSEPEAKVDTAETPDLEAAETPAPVEAPPTLAERALAAVEAYAAAFDAGDVEAALEQLAPSSSELADRRMLEFNAALGAAGLGTTTGSCEVTSGGSVLPRVECVQTFTDPVFLALGVSQVVTPFIYTTDGLMWQPFDGFDPAELGIAYRTYLQDRFPDDFATACDPASFGTDVVNNSGLALTSECGSLAAAHASDVAAWIEAGRPES